MFSKQVAGKKVVVMFSGGWRSAALVTQVRKTLPNSLSIVNLNTLHLPVAPLEDDFCMVITRLENRLESTDATIYQQLVSIADYFINNEIDLVYLGFTRDSRRAIEAEAQLKCISDMFYKVYGHRIKFLTPFINLDDEVVFNHLEVANLKLLREDDYPVTYTYGGVPLTLADVDNPLVSHYNRIVGINTNNIATTITPDDPYEGFTVRTPETVLIYAKRVWDGKFECIYTVYGDFNRCITLKVDAIEPLISPEELSELLDKRSAKNAKAKAKPDAEK